MNPNEQVSDTRDVPLEKRLRQKKQGFVTQIERERAISTEGRKARRASKNQPLELSSKRAVGRFRQVVEVKKKRLLDPRFEAQSGRLNEDLFNKSYAFVDEYKQRELQQLKQQLKKTKSVVKKDELKVSTYVHKSWLDGTKVLIQGQRCTAMYYLYSMILHYGNRR